MNLHLMLDEKVISRTILYFEEVIPNNNKYIILQSKEGIPHNHVFIEKENVTFEKYGTRRFWEVVGEIKQYRQIICHNLTDPMVDFLLKSNATCPIIWIIWGIELYNLLLTKRGYILYANPNDIGKIKTIKSRIAMKLLFFDEMRKYKRRLKAIEKISYVCCTDGDMKSLLYFYPEFSHLKKMNFFYYPIDDILGDLLISNKELGNNIIVGNSAQFTNNHRYVFELLSNISIGNRKVIVPLSYGEAPQYVIKCGKILGDLFCPITTFMPLNQYNELMISARTYIYGNFRQEAVGNILVALFLGATVFLDKRNPLFEDFSLQGYVVFSLDKIKNMIDYRLTKEEIDRNRKLIKESYSREKLLLYIKEYFG